MALTAVRSSGAALRLEKWGGEFEHQFFSRTLFFHKNYIPTNGRSLFFGAETQLKLISQQISLEDFW